MTNSPDTQRGAVDVHAHYLPPAHLKRVGKAVQLPPSAVLGSQTVPQRLELLDRTGVASQVLSVAHAQPYLESSADAREAAERVNDLFDELCEEHPRRFYAFAALPLPHVDEALSEIDRAAGLRSVVGFTIGCSVAGRQLDDASLAPVFEELSRREAVVFVHPVGHDGGAWLAGNNLTWLVGAPFEDTVAALRLVLAEIPSRYPGMRIIIPHLGGTIPFLFARLTRISRRPELASDLRRLYYDTVSASAAALACSCETVGADRLMFGTDYPYCDEKEFTDHLCYLSDVDLPASELSSVRGARAASLLRLGEG